MRRTRWKSRRGMVVVLSLGLVALLGALGSSLLLRSVHESQLETRSLRRHNAFFLAESAVDHAISNLRANNTANLSTALLATGSYWAEVADLGSQRYQITAHGLAASEQRNADVVVQRTGQSLFRYPLFAKDGVRVKKDGLTNSYDSRLGSYNPATAGNQGTIATNNTAAGSIELRKNTAVNGQVIVGPGLADPTVAVSMDASVVITGTPSIVSAPSPLSLPAVIPPSSPSCGTDLVLPKDATYTFTASNSPYCFNAIKADKNSVVAVVGDVVVYAGSLDFDKHMDVNAGGKPTQLLIQIYSDNDVVIDKDGTFKGAIYAPNSKVRLKKETDFFGAIAAEEVQLDKTSQFHYDEALASLSYGPMGSYEVSILSWREL